MKMIFSDLTCNNKENDLQVDLICQTAIRFIGISNKTSGRVIRYLQQKGYDDELIKAAITELKERSYIDDLIIARRMIRLRSGRKSVSAKAHRHYLINAGVCSEAVEMAVEELPPDEQTAPLALIGKFGKSVDCKTDSMIRFLCGRGYSVETARRAVNRFAADSQNNEPDYD